MADSTDEDSSRPNPIPDELRKLVEHLHQLDRPPNDEEVALLMKLARPSLKRKLFGGKSPGWPRPEPFPADPPGSDIPLRNDPK
ncbi:hypothetical protein [Humisphaera borealis]|uniref:Uncharacterized protein n=1 Tax=Humisphaera borealis TaxID=2807512 RepID=A0A7M2WT07_9BACT|nr:hypothetical protein [Humisphaera borealis]QOV88638.1 hypothetical protein IPV69_20715 [Humisphaera borealis]